MRNSIRNAPPYIYIGKNIVSLSSSLSRAVSKKSTDTVGVEEKVNRGGELKRVWRTIVPFTITSVVLRPLETNHSHFFQLD